ESGPTPWSGSSEAPASPPPWPATPRSGPRSSWPPLPRQRRPRRPDRRLPRRDRRLPGRDRPPPPGDRRLTRGVRPVAVEVASTAVDARSPQPVAGCGRALAGRRNRSRGAVPPAVPAAGAGTLGGRDQRRDPPAGGRRVGARLPGRRRTDGGGHLDRVGDPRLPGAAGRVDEGPEGREALEHPPLHERPRGPGGQLAGPARPPGVDGAAQRRPPGAG